MAHVEKYTRGAMGHMLAHYNRTKASSTSLIDPARTPLNYNLAETDQPLSQLDFIHKRLSEIKVLNRKDVNVFCDWIVTAPQELSENEYADFFRETYNFLNNRYGKENVISAYVHMDESQPHIHYAFVPVAIDKKKNIPKLSAKEVITLKELKCFHKDLSSYLNSFFDRDIGILNGATDLGNQTIKQLRNNSEKLKSYADTKIQTTTNIITKAMGKDKVLVSQNDIEATQQAAAEAAAAIESVNTAAEDIKQIRKKADKNFAKSEEWLQKLSEREHALTEREEKAVQIDLHNRTTAEQNAKETAEISSRLKACQEREHQLNLREDNPHKFYNNKIAELNEENLSLKRTAAELKSDNDTIRQNVSLLTVQLAKKEKDNSERLAASLSAREREISSSYEEQLREKDRTIKTLADTVETLKKSVRKAYQIICNICRAAAALWCGKDKFAEYCAKFTPKQNVLMCAILDYGSKCAKEADFPDLAEKIDKEFFIAEGIREEMRKLEPIRRENDYPVR